jgi:hypothetical protein
MINGSLSLSVTSRKIPYVSLASYVIDERPDRSDFSPE